MRCRYLLLVIGCLCTSVAAQGVAPPSSGYLRIPTPAPASTAVAGYRDTLSTAAKDAQRFNFSEGPMKDNAPPDQTPIRVIINNGRGAHVNCVPMGPGGACH
ncbi:hypothetical protein [Dyella telluris]|uniref:Uncharacterized protein n=1 Tax=Dyella telluris TaxID=2763498 RepID=A0A7G8Q765_9GAMM|nr:hypothetical protein [Dyella telluris]QNK02623.1 hypothetical protein H8F01_05665 [Dyella telluris]